MERKIAATLKMLVLSVKEVKEVAQMVHVVMLNKCLMITSDLPLVANAKMEDAVEKMSAVLISTCPMSSIPMI